MVDVTTNQARTAIAVFLYQNKHGCSVTLSNKREKKHQSSFEFLDGEAWAKWTVYIIEGIGDEWVNFRLGKAVYLPVCLPQTTHR